MEPRLYRQSRTVRLTKWNEANEGRGYTGGRKECRSFRRLWVSLFHESLSIRVNRKSIGLTSSQAYWGVRCILERQKKPNERRLHRMQEKITSYALNRGYCRSVASRLVGYVISCAVFERSEYYINNSKFLWSSGNDCAVVCRIEITYQNRPSTSHQPN